MLKIWDVVLGDVAGTVHSVHGLKAANDMSDELQGQAPMYRAHGLVS